MNSDIIGPDMSDELFVSLTDAQLRSIWGRIDLIEQHFNKCCAFMQDRCHFNDEYERLYQMLHSAGMSEIDTPCDTEYFEQWLGRRNV